MEEDDEDYAAGFAVYSCKLNNRVYVPRTQGEVPYKTTLLKDEGERRCGIEKDDNS